MTGASWISLDAAYIEHSNRHLLNQLLARLTGTIDFVPIFLLRQ